jgi:hypothetical protein
MQLILDIEESQKDVILNIIKNLKDGIVKGYTLKNSDTSKSHIEPVSTKEEQEIKEILQSMSDEDREVSDSKTYTITL